MPCEDICQTDQISIALLKGMTAVTAFMRERSKVRARDIYVQWYQLIRRVGGGRESEKG